MKVLHIVAAPRGLSSNTLRVSTAFLQALETSNPDVEIETLDLHSDSLPHLNPGVIGEEALAFDMQMKFAAMYGADAPRRHDPSWLAITAMVDQFKAADRYVISAPMWNWNGPSR